MSADLITRLAAALDTQEATARAAADAYGDTWTARDEGWVNSNTGADVLSEPDAPTDHIAHHDPAFVLADIAAKRAVIDLHQQREPGWCETCDVPADVKGNEHGCPTVLALAKAYGITAD